MQTKTTYLTHVVPLQDRSTGAEGVREKEFILGYNCRVTHSNTDALVCKSDKIYEYHVRAMSPESDTLLYCEDI